MKLVALQVDALHLLIAYFAPGWVFAPSRQVTFKPFAVVVPGNCQVFGHE
jgi:hypothetical protein